MWCDDGLYPRKLYVNMVNGQPNWRCACFKELGWSDLRQVRVCGGAAEEGKTLLATAIDAVCCCCLLLRTGVPGV